ncbi:hypothetical protein, partial [uncultured Tyzzerella sp.]|uniref:hypothetical protein n=1 Tax=uncultured Tyzzerella sp. TaxID=2321398 RepID=UPI002942ED20
KPLICILFSGIISKNCYNLIKLSYGNIFSLIIALAILCLIYLILLILVGALNKNDLGLF